VLLSFAFGLSTGLVGGAKEVQADLSASEQSAVTSYIRTFDVQSSSNVDRAAVLANYFFSVLDPYETIQYLLSIGSTFSEEMQFLIGNAIARYVDARGLEDPQLSESLAQMVEAQPIQAVLSGYLEQTETLTSQARRYRSANNSILDKIKEPQASPN